MRARIIRAVTRFQAIWRGHVAWKLPPASHREEEKQFSDTFWRENTGREGSNTAILFDRGRRSEAIYSCEIVKIAGEANAVQVYVRFHYDQERRRYHWRKFQKLERECHSFTTERGMLLLEFEGKIPTAP